MAKVRTSAGSPARRRAASKSQPKGSSSQQARNVTAIGARTILFVHGIGNKPEPATLKCQWDHALFEFGLGERSRLAYWVDREYYPDPLRQTCESGDRVELEDQPTGRALSVPRHLETVSLVDEVATVTDNPRHRAVLLSLAKRLEAQSETAARTGKPGGKRASGVEAEGLTAAEIQAKLLPLPEWLRRWITRKITRAFIRDSHEFFFVEKARARMIASVADRIRAGGGPFVVIAHSQGSMVAYAALQQLPDADVPLFVTIGSPMAVQEVQDQLVQIVGHKKLPVPACVRRWVNVTDLLDPVSLDKRLRGEYHGAIEIEDHIVWNPDSPRNPHSATGYLRTRPVQDVIRDSVRTELFQPVADFILARNVARDLENAHPEARHPVLIELADPAKQASVDLAATRSAVLASIAQVAKGKPEEIRLDPLRRYVSAWLTRSELESLSGQYALGSTGADARPLQRVWKNALKRALVTTTTQTLHVSAAQNSYSALGRDIAWAVLDSGIAPHAHFDTHKNVVAEHDCTKEGALKAKGGKALDENGHGTHVAGIIAGSHELKGPDGTPVKVSGMAPQARLHVYRVLDRQGSGEDAWIIKALDHIADVNERGSELVIHGVNLSLGGPFDQSNFGCGHSPLCRELRRLWRQGVVVVIAAGNEGFAELQTSDGWIPANLDLSIGDPANLEEAIAVGSVHKTKPHTYGVSYFSSRGPTADGRQKPDVVAPGERVLSCRHKITKAAGLPGLYVEMSGTSMAAPHVSGLIAAFLSVKREFIGYPDRVKEILLGNCTDLGRDRAQQGAGMPNLVKMLVTT